MLHVQCAAVFDTLARDFLALIPVERLEDSQLASRRQEQRETRNNSRQSSRGLAKRCREESGEHPGRSCNRLNPPTERDPEGRQCCDVQETVPTLCELVSVRPSDHFDACFGDDANRTAFTSARKRPAENERSFCPPGHGSMVMQVTPQQSLCWECSTYRTTSGLSLDGCDVRLVDKKNFVGVDANMVPIGEDETLNAHGLMKCVDQKIHLQMTCWTSDRPEGQIAALGLSPRQRAEATESFRAPVEFLNRTVVESQPTKSVPRQVRLAIERNIAAISPNPAPQPRLQRRHRAWRVSRRLDRFEGLHCSMESATWPTQKPRKPLFIRAAGRIQEESSFASHEQSRGATLDSAWLCAHGNRSEVPCTS